MNLIFSEKQLVHTGRVWFDLGHVRYFKLWCFELKFDGDLPFSVLELWLKFHDFWTPFDGVLNFSLSVSVVLKIPDAYRTCPISYRTCPIFTVAGLSFLQFARLGSDLCSVCCVGFLSFPRLYLGALTTS